MLLRLLRYGLFVMIIIGTAQDLRQIRSTRSPCSPINIKQWRSSNDSRQFLIHASSEEMIEYAVEWSNLELAELSMLRGCKDFEQLPLVCCELRLSGASQGSPDL